MKIKKAISVLCLFCCMMGLTMPASARASDVLEDYWMNSGTSGSRIYVEFDVTGTGRMDSIGCESIVIEKSINDRWEEVQSRDEFDSGMSDTNARSFGNTIYFNNISDGYYKVVVTIFAENDVGTRDTRQRTFYVTYAS